MEVTFVKNPEIVKIDNARIVWRHFSGEPDDFHRAGERDFQLVIPNQEIADAFIENGYNVSIKAPQSEDEDPFIKLKVKIGYSDRSHPNVYLVTGNKVTELTEETIECLDKISIARIDMDIRPYDWGPINGKYGRTAYLKNLKVVQDLDRFALEFAEEEFPGEAPFED